MVIAIATGTPSFGSICSIEVFILLSMARAVQRAHSVLAERSGFGGWDVYFESWPCKAAGSRKQERKVLLFHEALASALTVRGESISISSKALPRKQPHN